MTVAKLQSFIRPTIFGIFLERRSFDEYQKENKNPSEQRKFETYEESMCDNTNIIGIVIYASEHMTEAAFG